MHFTTHIRFFLFFILTMAVFSVTARASCADTLTVMEWNVENLFDCRHDTLKNDLDFLPESIHHWTPWRFRNKLDKVAKVIMAVGEWNPPTLVALCEVENDSVLYALTKYSALKEMSYRYVMTDSPDSRGIDVALMYQRDKFKLIGSESIRIPKYKDFKPTRDILHVTGMVLTGDTLDIFVVHAPSRMGGATESEPYRLYVAGILRDAANRIMHTRCHPFVIITGDFNDFPENHSIADVLQAKAPERAIQDNRLYHLLARHVKESHAGTYKYKGEWNLLDHLIVSGNFLDGKHNLHTDEKKAEIVTLPFLLTDDEKYGGKCPFRTYYGMKYKDGYSDHLPIRLQIIVNQ